MDCSKCGAENPDDAGFCQKCGESLAAAAAPAKSTKGKAKKAKPKKAAAAAAKKEKSEGGGFTEMMDKLPVAAMLLWGALAVLVIGLLYGLMASIGADDVFKNGSFAFAQFLEGLIYGVVGAGVMLALHVIVKSKE